MNNKIHSVISDFEQEEELVAWLKKRFLDQKFIYIQQWAKYYYDAVDRRSKFVKWAYENDDFYYSFIEKHITKWEKIAIISLWCGDWRQEKETLRKLHQDWHSIDYFWVDYSQGMLDLAIKNLKDIPGKKEFIYADLTTKKFRQEVDMRTKWYDRRIFAFMGYTFASKNQTELWDSLFNLLWPEDYVWIDFCVRTEVSKKKDFEIFKRFEQFYLYEEDKLKSNLAPLELLNIPKDSWTLRMKVVNEDFTGSMLMIYYFAFDKSVTVSLRWDTIHIWEWQELYLMEMRIYSIEWFKKFLENHWFVNIDSYVEKTWEEIDKWQVLYKIGNKNN